MTIDIILPVYNAFDTILSCLNSICDQKVDAKVKVTILDDASYDTYDYLYDMYKNKLDINIIRFEDNTGPGAKRKWAIEHTNGDYLLFLDADDVLYEDKALANLLNKIQEGYDVVYGMEYNQEIKNITISFSNMHGKLYSRKYINDNHITYPDTRYHDDNFFNNNFILTGANICAIEDVVYIYIHNKESLTRKDTYTDYNSLEDFFKNMKKFNDEIDYTKVIDLYRKFLKEKYRFVNRLYNESDDEQKKHIEELVKENDPNNIPLVGAKDKDDLKERINELYK